MSEAPANVVQTGRPRGTPLLAMQIGWRNLWRNKRRTWLTAGGIAFAILLVVFSMAMQFGSYESMTENATSLLTGHLQIQNPAYVDNQRIEYTVVEATALRRQIEAIPGVIAVAPRVEAFVLASVGERSSGVQILGVDVAAEQRAVRFFKFVKQGRLIQAADDAVVGLGLARNLGLGVGDELVLLGSAKKGGMAALALNVVGIFESGMAELDRGLLIAQIETVQNAFDLADEVHTFAIKVADLEEIDTIIGALQKEIVRDDIVVRHWDEVLPELRQMIELDRLSGEFLYWIVMILVAFSVVNSFIMTVFERTREFGMLLALGTRPLSIVTLVLWEALFMWVLGALIGLSLATGLIWWLAEVGIYMGESMEEIAAQFYVPARIYPSFSAEAMLTAPLVMLIGTLLAALVPALRIPLMEPVEALRAE